MVAITIVKCCLFVGIMDVIAKKAEDVVDILLEMDLDDDRERLLQVCLSLTPWKLSHADCVLGWQGALYLLWPKAPNTLNCVFVPLDVLILRTCCLLDTITASLLGHGIVEALIRAQNVLSCMALEDLDLELVSSPNRPYPKSFALDVRIDSMLINMNNYHISHVMAFVVNMSRDVILRRTMVFELQAAGFRDIDIPGGVDGCTYVSAVSNITGSAMKKKIHLNEAGSNRFGISSVVMFGKNSTYSAQRFGCAMSHRAIYSRIMVSRHAALLYDQRYFAVFEDDVFNCYPVCVTQHIISCLLRSLAESASSPDLIFLYSISPDVWQPLTIFADIHFNYPDEETSQCCRLVQTRSAYGCQAILLTKFAAEILSASQSFENEGIHSSDGLIRRAISAKRIVAAHFVDSSGHKFDIFNTFPTSFKGGSRVH